MSAPVAIITGAGRGIGRATAVALAGEGWRCALVSRNRDELQETAALAPGSIVVPADVTDTAQINEAVQSTLSQLGRVDGLVNNAGAAPSATIESITHEQWRQIIDTNLSAAVFLAQAVWGEFVKQKSGVIVNISSPAAVDPFPGLGFYGIAKAGMNLLSRELSRHGAAHNIKVHTVAPSSTETAMFRSLFSEKQVPRSQTLEPADVAKVICDCMTGKIRHASGEIIYLKR